MKQILEGTHEPNVQSPEVFKNPSLPFPVVGSVLEHNWIIQDTSPQPKNLSPFEKKEREKKNPAHLKTDRPAPPLQRLLHLERHRRWKLASDEALGVGLGVGGGGGTCVPGNHSSLIRTEYLSHQTVLQQFSTPAVYTPQHTPRRSAPETSRSFYSAMRSFHKKLISHRVLVCSRKHSAPLKKLSAAD